MPRHLRIWQWVDNINQWHEGTEQTLVDSLVPAAVDFHGQIQQQELDISGKSIVIASSMDLARSISQQPVGAGSVGADRGASNGAADGAAG